MQPQIYILNKKNIDLYNFEYFYELLDEYKMEKYTRQLDKKKKVEIILSDIFLKVCIKKVFGIDIKQQKFEYNENGKPYLLNVKNVYFNISNSDDYMVCVIYNEPIGIDIEKIRFCSKILIENVCSVEEIEKVKNSEDRDSLFIKFWTQKEAVIKKNGKSILKENLKIINLLENIKSFEYDNHWISICV